MKCFKNTTVYVEGQGLKKCSVSFDSTILKIARGPLKGAEEIQLPENAIVVPGFIDQHTHGAGGSDVIDGTVETILNISKTIVAEGTTSYLPTTMTQSVENVTKALTAIKEYRELAPEAGARVVGANLEGPFLDVKFKGAHPMEYLVAPTREIFDKYNEASGNCIRIVTVAPELDGAKAFIRYVTEMGVVASVGHTAAKYEEIKEAVSFGASNVTHAYNAQTPLHHREIGAVGSAMLLDELNCEIIADTVHVSVPAIKVLVKCKPRDKVTLITDSMRAKGLPDGIYDLGGQTSYVKDGEARLKDGTLSGSVLRMNRAVQNLVEKVGVSFTDAIDFATINPAKNIRMDKEIGSIAEGKRADFTVLNERFDVLMTVRDGKIVYQA